MKRSYLLCFCVFTLLSANLLYSQTPQQTVRGRVIDEDTRAPLPGATIMVVGSQTLGATTDEDGNFRIMVFNKLIFSVELLIPAIMAL